MKDNAIYHIINLKTHKRYIGRTNNPESRKYRHFNALKNGTHHCVYLQRSYDKHGVESFRFEIIKNNLSINEAIEVEQYYLDNEANIYNVSNSAKYGGDLISNHPHKEDIIRKIVKSLNERYSNMTELERKLMSENLKGKKNPNYGNKGIKSPLYKKPKTKSHKQKISKSLKGREISKQHKHNISASKKGSIPWNKGKNLSPLTSQHKSNISHSLKDREQEWEWLPVVCESIFFPSVKFAAEMYNVSKTTIVNRMKSNKIKWKDFFYFDETIHKKFNYTIFTDSNTHLMVSCEGIVFNSLKDAKIHFGFNSTNAIVYRIESNLPKWQEYFYID